jgi:hypothetical protein
LGITAAQKEEGDNVNPEKKQDNRSVTAITIDKIRADAIRQFVKDTFGDGKSNDIDGFIVGKANEYADAVERGEK